MHLPIYNEVNALSCTSSTVNPDTRLEGLCMAQIPTAALTGARTTTVTYPTGTNNRTIKDVLNRLRQGGYTVTNDATTLTITWPTVTGS